MSRPSKASYQLAISSEDELVFTVITYHKHFAKKLRGMRRYSKFPVVTVTFL
ncbi:hypothetical protein [uncultured Lactobacillus sp.]|uniref:hypothetical protein n=1 Tax=uncultured Lactobacillus sp. TaxID=153152 RepID=UPI0025D87E9E|nr:hypothetical protein [uncultured Lactobacillus sp.]